jgi:probable rRNA maturation factor
MPAKIEKIDLEKYAATALKKWVKAVEAHRLLKVRVFSPDAIREKRSFQVDLTVCTTLKMTKLNHQYRGKKEPTDVLSFAADHFFQGQGVLGDLVICAPIILKQAKEYQHSWKKEVDLLLVHGLLHLLHFDHEQGKKEALEMAKWEKKILGSKTLITRASES